MKFEMRKTALQKKLTLNSYSLNGKKIAERLLISSSFTLFESCLKPILDFFKMFIGSDNQEVKRSFIQPAKINVNNLPKDYIAMCLTCRSLTELFNFIRLVQEYIYSIS